ncbi:MAG TPA: YihY/virulence factor BrkB family protein [Thermodesulfobacteriota bacterium]
MRELKKDNIWIRSSAMAYHFFLALFPALIFLLTLIAYIPIDGLEMEVEVLGKSIIPPDTFEFIWPAVKGIVSEKKTGLLSVSFILTLYLTTQGVYVMIMTFYKDSLAFVKRSFVKERLIAALLVIIETLLLLLAFAIHVLSTYVIGFLMHKGTSHSITSLFLIGLKWFLEFFIVFFGVSFIYYVIPSVIKRWSFINPGSIIAFLMIILATAGFFYYVNNFADYNKIYGSLGAIVILMVWFYWVSFAILIGFELNTSIDHACLNNRKLE